MNEYLEAVYTNPQLSGAFTGPANFYRWLKLHGTYKPTLKYIKKWLQGVEAYTLHKEIKRRFPRNKVYVTELDELWQADLANFDNISKHNDGYKYVLYVIDVLSRYCWARPLKSKKPGEVIKAMTSIFNEGRVCLRFYTDKGGEFTSKLSEQFFKNKNIVHTTAHTTELKASICERLIKTQKAVMYRYFTRNNTHRFIDKLQQFVSGYNNRFHRTIRQSPASVNAENHSQVWFKMYAEPLLLKPGGPYKQRFKIGDFVRITHIKSPFTRDFYQRWSGEIFSIEKVVTYNRIPMYTIIDYHSEPITGHFYAQELQRVDIDKDSPYKVEKVLKTRRVRGKTEYLVKFIHWPAVFNQWIPETDMTTL